jgi:DNA-binding transcriptional LysR family regulator
VCEEMRFTLRQLQFFVAACDAGTVTLAAQRSSISQSAVSAALAELERSLGVQLLIRHHAHGVVPTPAGRQLLSHARGLLQQAGELDRLATELTEDITGRIALGCLVTLAPIVTPQLCREFRETHSYVEIDLHEGGQDELLSMLRNGELNLALTYDLDIPNDIAYDRLAELPPCALLPANHRLAKRTELDLADLAAEPYILVDLPLSRDYFRALFIAKGLQPEVAMKSSHLETIRSLVANGFGYSLLNVRPALDRSLDGLPLAIVPLRGDHRPMQLGLGTLAGARQPKAVGAFIEHCRASISNDAIPGMQLNR